MVTSIASYLTTIFTILQSVRCGIKTWFCSTFQRSDWYIYVEWEFKVLHPDLRMILCKAITLTLFYFFSPILNLNRLTVSKLSTVPSSSQSINSSIKFTIDQHFHQVHNLSAVPSSLQSINSSIKFTIYQQFHQVRNLSTVPSSSQYINSSIKFTTYQQSINNSIKFTTTKHNQNSLTLQ